MLRYNNELSLSCTITIAYYNARKDYTLIREFPTGGGFVDIVFISKKHSNKPAMIVELKWNHSAEGQLVRSRIKNMKVF